MKITSLPSSGKFLPSTQKHTHTHLSLNLKAQTVCVCLELPDTTTAQCCLCKIRETETTEKKALYLFSAMPVLACSFCCCTCDTKALQRRE